MDRWIPIAKVVALLAFVLPWVTVSCQNQVLASVSGLDLMTGSISMTNPMTGATETRRGDPSLWALLGFATILVGLGLAWFRRRRGGERFALATSLLAILFCWLATRRLSSQAMMEEASSGGRSKADAEMAAAMIRIEYGIGFWLVMAALAVAAFLAFKSLRPDAPPGAGPG